MIILKVKSGGLTEPIWDPTTVPHPYPSNEAFVRDYTVKLLSSSYPNMTIDKVTAFLDGLFDSISGISSVKNYICDFLVQSKEFSALDNKDLYMEEAAAERERYRQRALSIPGLIAPNEILEEMLDS